jgi:small subunit ribosomal protein S8e
MAISQWRSNRKKSGGRYKRAFSKQKAHNGGVPALTRIGAIKFITLRVLGGAIKHKSLLQENVNVAEGSKITKDVVVSVVENDSNRNYIRRNIITKGAIVELKSGKKARITSRPGQNKVLNAVIVA